MSAKDQFEAAVKVIQGLPKDGPFQPSHAMMLKFYGYYKQATEGDCNIAKPAFWEVVKKAKFEAWKAREGLPREDAMKAYVEELKKIIETMSFSTDVATFMEVLGPFYEYLSPEDLNHNEKEDSGIEVGSKRDPQMEDIVRMLGQYELDQPDDGESDVEAFAQKTGELLEELNKATKEVATCRLAVTEFKKQQKDENFSDSNDEYEDVLEEPSSLKNALACQSSDVHDSLQRAVKLLNEDFGRLNTRLSALEAAGSCPVKDQRDPLHKSTKGELSKKTLCFIILWPLFAQGLIAIIASFRRAR